MALGPDKYRFNKGLGRPLRTFKELAEEFGLTPHQLTGEMSQTHVPHPEPAKINGITRLSHHNSYYDPNAMRVWWAKHRKDKVQRRKI
jgi:hypothetical protein